MLYHHVLVFFAASVTVIVLVRSLMWSSPRKAHAFPGGNLNGPRSGRRGGSNLFAYLSALFAVAITISMVVYPDAAFQSAVEGLKVWWDIVFPALLPFFIGSEILMGLGVVHFMGVLLEPFMRPLFNVPGVGSFVLAMGLASGYPLGSILTAKLRRDKLCSKTEAERLMSFTNTADPLFMTGAVAVGMFHDISVGFVIIGAHYLSALAVGLILAFYKRNQDRSPALEVASQGNIFVKALRALIQARDKDGRPLGKLMGDAVRQSVNSLLLIGGFIILFSVVVRILSLVGVVSFLTRILATALTALGWNPEVAPSLVSGFFEITMGAQAASRAPVPLADKVMAASALIAWSGLSVHAQVAAVTQGTDINMGPYVGARVIHAALAAVIAGYMMGPAQPVTVWLAPQFAPVTHVGTPFHVWAARLRYFSLRFAIWSCVLIVGGLVVAACSKPALKVILCGGRKPPRRRR